MIQAPGFVMLSVSSFIVMPSIIMIGVVMISVVMMNVVAPILRRQNHQSEWTFSYHVSTNGIVYQGPIVLALFGSRSFCQRDILSNYKKRS